MFQRILVPLDGSPFAEQAIPIAVRLVHASGGTLLLLHIAGLRVKYGPYLARSGSYSHMLFKEEIASAYHYLQQLARREDLTGISVQLDVFAGRVAQTIGTAAQLRGADMVVLCHHGFTGIRRWAMGSVTHDLIRHSGAPVLALRADSPFLKKSSSEFTRSFRVLVAVDGSSFANSAIEAGIQLAAALNPPPTPRTLHLVRMVQPAPFHEQLAIEQAGLDVDLQEEVLKEASDELRTMAETAMHQQREQFGVHIEWSVEEVKDVVEALLSCGEETERPDATERVLVLATHGRTGLQRLREGSIAERLLNKANFPLLIIHPKQRLGQREPVLEEVWREKV